MKTTEENITVQKDWWFLLVEETEKLMNSFLEIGVLKKFFTIKNYTNNGKEVTIAASIYDNGSRVFTYDIYRGQRHDDQHIHIVRKPWGYLFIIDEFTTADELCWDILDTLNERDEELKIERHFASIDFKEYKVIPSDQKQDYEGYDVIIEGKFGNMPLQLKSNRHDQKEHEEKYPNIPSLVYLMTSDIQKTLKLVKEIYSAYFDGKILHFNTLIKAPR